MKRENFEKALSLDSQSAIIYYNISRCYRLLNNPQKANDALEKAKLIIPQTPTQAVELAMFYYKISDAKNALKTINDATYTFCDDKKVYKAKIKLNKLLGNYHEYEKAKVELLMKFGVKTLD